MPFSTITAVPLYYEVAGDGPALCLIAARDTGADLTSAFDLAPAIAAAARWVDAALQHAAIIRERLARSPAHPVTAE
jgi:hypothetical protein